MEDNFWYLFAAYSVIWAVVLGFVYSLFVREKNLERELRSLKGRLSSKARERRRVEERASAIPSDGDGSGPGLFEEVTARGPRGAGP